MRPLRYSVNFSLDGCVDHAAFNPGEDVHQYAANGIAANDALLLGRVTYQMMEDGWRQPLPPESPSWARDFASTMNASKKYVVSSTLRDLDWNAEVIRGDLADAVRALKAQPGKGIGTGGVTLPLALAELGLIDEYDFVVHPQLTGHGPYLLQHLSKVVQLRPLDRIALPSGAIVLKYAPVR